MKRTSLFLLVTIVAIVSLTVVIVAGYFVLAAPSADSTNRWGNMWTGMMGGHMNGYDSGIQTQNTAAPYFGVVFFIMVALAVVGIIGLIYFALFPEIRASRVLAQPLEDSSVSVSAATQVSGVNGSPYESVLKTLTADERKVIEVLSSHDGKYLQKYIRSETGLSRLQTHRIVARLAERGIITLEKTGNTNTVSMASWLK